MSGCKSVILGAVAWAYASAQTGLVVSSAGYYVPDAIPVAPGQMITLYVRAGGDVPDGTVTAGPGRLPTSLAGFQVTLLQTFPSNPILAPISAVQPVKACSPLAPAECVASYAVTVQIPFELTPNIPRTGRPENFAALRVTRGDTSGLLLLHPQTDSIHIVNSCDPGQQLPGGCYPIVTHVDGTVVSRLSPARTGETLTMNIVGLGVPVNDGKTGEPGGDAVAVDGVRIAFDARPNSAGIDPGDGAPQSASLMAGGIGVYQVTFRVPSPPDGLPVCDSTVKSNLTVSVGRMTSSDVAGICVQP